MSTRQPYFRTPERILALREEARRWDGTRWHHCGTRPNDMKPGVFGDCLAALYILKGAGAVPAELKLPEYLEGDSFHDTLDRIREGMKGFSFFDCVCDRRLNQVPIPLMGDVCLSKFGNSAGHLALCLQSTPVLIGHMPLRKRRWTVETVEQRHLLEQLDSIWRPMEVYPPQEGR